MDKERLFAVADDALITGDFDKALDAINQILKEGEDEKANYLKAYLYFCKNDFERAIPELEFVTEHYPNNEDAHYYLAQLYAGNGEFESAKSSIEKALKCDPENTDYLGDYISIEQALKNYTHCIELCDTLLEEMHDNPFALNARGFCNMQLGDTDTAIKDFKKCSKYNPTDFMSWNYMGMLLIEKGDFKAAEKALKKAISNNPQYSDAFANFGTLFLRKEMHHDAILALNRSLELDPQNPEAFKKRAEVHLASGDTGEARRDLLQAEEFGYSYYFDDQVEKMLASLSE